MSTGTVHLHRVLRAPTERVFRAFLDPHAVAKWLPPFGYTNQVHELDARVGGRFRMTFIHFASGHAMSFGGTYLDIEPNVRLRYTDRFDDPNLPGEMVTTASFKAVSGGTELSVVQEGIPAAIPTDMCYLGWQESLLQLAQLLEGGGPAGA